MKKRVIILGASSSIAKAYMDSSESESDFVSVSRTLTGNAGARYTVDDFSGDLPEVEGSLDGLLYFPGTISLKPFRSLKLSDFQEDLDINFLGAVNAVQRYLKNLKESAKASVVLISSSLAKK